MCIETNRLAILLLEKTFDSTQVILFDSRFLHIRFLSTKIFNHRHRIFYSLAQVAEKLKEMKLSAAAKKLQDGIDETLTYMNFPTQHWSRIRTNNTIERLNREIKRRTKAIGAFPDGQSALMLVCARLRHVAGTQWGTKRYMNMDHLYHMESDTEPDNIAG